MSNSLHIFNIFKYFAEFCLLLLSTSQPSDISWIIWLSLASARMARPGADEITSKVSDLFQIHSHSQCHNAPHCIRFLSPTHWFIFFTLALSSLHWLIVVCVEWVYLFGWSLEAVSPVLSALPLVMGWLSPLFVSLSCHWHSDHPRRPIRGQGCPQPTNEQWVV